MTTAYNLVLQRNEAPWMDEALCRTLDLGTVDAWFFDDSLAGHGRAQAQMVCARCPVADLCFERAIKKPTKHEGINAGVVFTSSTKSVKRLRRARAQFIELAPMLVAEARTAVTR